MAVIREPYELDESVIEEAFRTFISDLSVHSGATDETAKKARVARICELVGVDNFYTGDQAIESTVVSRLNTSTQTIVDINMYDISKRPKMGALGLKIVDFWGWVQIDICTLKSRYHANSIKREIDGLIMLGLDLTLGDETLGIQTTIKGELVGVPGKREDAGYWRAIIKIPVSGWTKGVV